MQWSEITFSHKVSHTVILSEMPEISAMKARPGMTAAKLRDV